MKRIYSALALLPALTTLAADKPSADNEWRAVQTCQVAIRLTVQDPNSLEFPDGITRAYRKLGKNGIYTVQVHIRARNGFNALRTSTIECKVGPDARLLSIREIR
jgi:hypothetical protein